MTQTLPSVNAATRLHAYTPLRDWRSSCVSKQESKHLNPSAPKNADEFLDNLLLFGRVFRVHRLVNAMSEVLAQ